jgi:beta-glucosidase
MTWFRSAADLPPIEDFDIRKGRTYWYFQGQPLYPFGYGLSYTTFDYRNLAITPGAAGPADAITVRLDVQNTGTRAGDEVVQLYTHARDSKVQRPLQELKRFQRVALQPGETRSLSFTLPVSGAAGSPLKTARWRSTWAAHPAIYGCAGRCGSMARSSRLATRSRCCAPRITTITRVFC